MSDDRPNPVAADGPTIPDDAGISIEVRSEPDRTVVALSGDVDAVAAPALRTTLADVIDRAPVTVRIDMAGVDFLDSVGISVLVASFNRAMDAGVGFELISVPPSSRRVLEITRLTDVFTILD